VKNIKGDYSTTRFGADAVEKTAIFQARLKAKGKGTVQKR
jgi:hypothetical protein